MKGNNHRIIGVPKGEEIEQGNKNLFEEIMAENFLNLVKEIDIQVQEAQRVPNIKGEINSNIVIVENFYTPLTSMDRSPRQKINKRLEMAH